MAERWARNGAILIAVAGFAAFAVGLLARIPAFGPDWTDFNAGDPGITLVQLFLFLLLPLLFVVEAAAVHQWSPASAKLATRAALAFATMFASLAAIVPFVGLTALRADVYPIPAPWPAIAAAIGLLAWNLLLGLALLFAVPAFPDAGLGRAIRFALAVAGLLCLAGLAAALGAPRIRPMLAAAQAFALPAAASLLAAFFHRERSPS